MKEDLFHEYSTGDTPGFSSVSATEKNRSEVVKFTGKMRNELKRMKNQYSDFFNF